MSNKRVNLTGRSYAPFVATLRSASYPYRYATKAMKKLVPILLLASITSATHAVELKIFTEDGYVSFAAEDQWPVIASQTKPPVAVMAFQIPNQGDASTQDSTNLSISLFTLNSPKAQSALAKIGKSFGFENPTNQKYKDWETYSQRAMQEQTSYTILDATKKVANVVVAARLAWPTLNTNRMSYDQEMRKLFYNFLDSINGYTGKYEPKPNEVVRRPVN